VLIKFLLWCLSKLGWTPPVTLKYIQYDIPADVQASADNLVKRYETLEDGVSGEYKRHQVYAVLLETYPLIPSYKLAFAIELAIWNRRK
jgi:hypothetical protein